MDNTTHRILAGIACEVGQLDGTIAMLQEARDATERPEVRKEIHAQVLDELSRRNGLYRALQRGDWPRTAIAGSSVARTIPHIDGLDTG